MKVDRINAVLPTLSVKDTLAFYQSIFCNSEVFYPGDKNEYAVLIVDGTASVHFARVETMHPTERHSLMIFVDDPDAYHEKCKTLPVDIDTPMQEGHGLREFRIRDNDGRVVVIAKYTGEESNKPNAKILRDP